MNSKLCSSTRWVGRGLAVLAVGTLVPVLASQHLASAQPKGAVPTPAATAAPSTPPAPRASDASARQRDPDAIAALEKMGAYLRTLPSFALRSETATDELAPNGQKIQFIGTSDMHVRRPDRMRLDIDADKKQRQAYYDGKSLTLYGPKVNYYGSIPAPGTIGEMLTMVEDKYDIELPLVDLFRWGTPAANLDEITAATVVGPSKVGTIACDHYAFRQPDEDWQIWIEKGATPLPRKLLITTLDEPGQPQHSELLTWDLTYKPSEDAFVFKPPSGAQKIAVAKAPESE